MPPFLDSNVPLDNIHIKEVSNIAPVTVKTPDVADMGLRITHLPDIRLAITEPVVIDSTSTINLHIKEIPEVRMHIPANFSVGLAILGMELLTLSLCGEAQVITEKYVPRKPEICL